MLRCREAGCVPVVRGDRGAADLRLEDDRTAGLTQLGHAREEDDAIIHIQHVEGKVGEHFLGGAAGSTGIRLRGARTSRRRGGLLNSRRAAARPTRGRRTAAGVVAERAGPRAGWSRCGLAGCSAGDGGEQRRRAAAPPAPLPACGGAGTRRGVTWPRTGDRGRLRPAARPTRGAIAAPPPARLTGCQGALMPDWSESGSMSETGSASRRPVRARVGFGRIRLQLIRRPHRPRHRPASPGARSRSRENRRRSPGNRGWPAFDGPASP